MKYPAILIALLLTGCATLDQYPPIYGCEGLAQFGCPNQPPRYDHTR